MSVEIVREHAACIDRNFFICVEICQAERDIKYGIIYFKIKLKFKILDINKKIKN